ncbi:MAG TPA: polymer-forming cytoskeletal protein [Actinomycetota bacterium]
MITAILVSLVVLSLSLVVINLAVHNSSQSAFDRDRVMAIHAAEAGLDNYLSGLTKLDPVNPVPPCNASLDVGASPVEHYDVSVLLFDTWPPTGPGACPLPVGQEAAGALVTAKGTALSAAPAVSRKMETAVRLTPVFGGLNQAIFSNDQLNFQNKLEVNGNVGNDGDVYTNGDFALGNNTVISGTVYAQGYAKIGQGVVKANVWANNYVDLSGGISVLGNVTSSTSYITLANAHVYGEAKAGTTITVPGNSQIDGSRTPNSPSGPPPQIPLPQVPYVQSEWIKAGYTIVNYSSCALAKTFINSAPVGNYVVRITPTCALSWGNNSTINLKGNMAIITDGSFTTVNQTSWNGVGSKYTLFIIRPYQAGLPCNPTPSPYDINVSNNTSFNNLQVFVYSQCTINFGNNNASGFDGQIIGGQVNITNQMVVNFKPITVPGFNKIGYRSDVSYLREVPS